MRELGVRRLAEGGPAGYLPVMSQDEIARRLELAVAAGREAGQLTLRYFCQDNYEVELKDDLSPVTVADRSAEEWLRQRIGAAFPRDAVLGEEFGATAGESGYRWILDPIDGTKSFVHGVPLYGTMIGVEREGRSLVGVVYMPGLDELIYAAVGEGAWHQTAGGPPRRARVSARSRLEEALFVTTAVKSFTEVGRRAAYEGLEEACRITRTWGDCYGYLLVATGRAEVMIDPVMNVWDAAALQPILEEAGGTFTDWAGERTIHSGEGVATNGAVEAAVLEFTRPWAAGRVSRG